MPPDREEDVNSTLTDIAIVGLSCRFPGADNVEMFWNNLVQGVESISRFSKEELRAEGCSEELIENPQYVNARGILNDLEKFDANFFGFNPRDARITDPQHKLFMECVWEALESSGYVPEKTKEMIGVYASMADSSYVKNNLYSNKEFLNTVDWFQTRIATSITTLSSQTSYRLNLTGPSINISTACSSALVAIATACQELMDYRCDIAIAGAAAVYVPQKSGYLYQEGGIESPDGHCRAYDANANGTVFSNGIGVTVLRRLEDAVRDGDFIYGVIKGWNVNNDGGDKVGFTAPSVNGQAKCIAGALAFADITPDSIQYIEGHGTGTTLGDAVELMALTKVFGAQTSDKQFCTIGSVKTNIGHTDIAAGMASFIKTVLALKTKTIPATLNYTAPNEKIDFANSPFYVNSELKKWDFGPLPRRAGINASGIGGTNAFLVLEEYEKSPLENVSRPYQLLLLSAKTETALEQQTQNLIRSLEKIQTSNELADIAFTLQVGRADFKYRKAIICNSVEDALAKLRTSTSEDIYYRNYKGIVFPNIVFMFSGQGTQYIGMGKVLYNTEAEFSRLIDDCCRDLDLTIKEKVYAFIVGTLPESEMTNTLILQPALFILEYALAKFWIYLGVLPHAMIGHSLGEYVAACIGGVMSVGDALKLICLRAKLMASTAPGMMLAVEKPAELILPFLNQTSVSIAAINTPTSCVISGDSASLCELEQKFKELEISTLRLKVAHAFHSKLMEPILKDFRAALEQIELKPSKIPFMSNLTGNWIKNEEVITPDYWVDHLRYTVKFSRGLQTMVTEGYQVFIEIGPGRTLSQLARMHIKELSDVCIQNTLPPLQATVLDQEHFLRAILQLWVFGVRIEWKNFYQYEKRSRVPLETYPFEKNVYWVTGDDKEKWLTKQQPYSKWFYEPSWERSSLSSSEVSKGSFAEGSYWIIFCDDLGLGEDIYNVLVDNGQNCIKVKSGTAFSCLSSSEYTVCTARKEDFLSLMHAIKDIVGTLPLHILNLFSLTKEHDSSQLDLLEVQTSTHLSFYSVIFFTQALMQATRQNINMLIVGNEIFSVTGTESIYPAKATAIGALRAIPLENSGINIRLLDILLSDYLNDELMCNRIIVETLNKVSGLAENAVAFRGAFRWKQIFKPINLEKTSKLRIKANGLYLVLGGLGGIGLTIAKYIAKSVKNPKIVLTSRKGFLEEGKWGDWLKQYGKLNETSKKILRLKELKDLGAEIVILKADIENLEQMTTIINNIKKMGPISGVVHAAGISGNVALISQKTEEALQSVLASKVQGAYILTHLLRNEALDFFIFCSSISAILGVLGRVEYAAANACLDAFAYTNVSNTPSVFKSINWNIWREVGMAAEIVHTKDHSLFNSNSISSAEGSNIFANVLGSDYKQVIVSTLDVTLPDRYSQIKSQDTNSALPLDLLKNTAVIQSDNHVEAVLLKIWQDLLGIDKISPADDFYEVGGNSLAMLHLLAQIERKFNVKINLRLLQELRTVKAFAKKLMEIMSNQAKETLVVNIRSAGNQLPLFCLHPGDGTTFCYRPLEKLLKFECPIYALQDPSLEKGTFLFNSLEEMASYYVTIIQATKEHGPYILCGFSFGGMLAVEVARQLRNKGEEVKPLILLDTWAKLPDQYFEITTFEQTMIRQIPYIKSEPNLLNLCWERMNLLSKYKIPEVNEKIILFKAQSPLVEELGFDDNNTNYWNEYARAGLEVHVIPGAHESILQEPNINFLVNQLNSILITYQDELMSEHV
jgi:acyl transferase domain-containing protein/thioesterase domain-containing protein/acyl carrier protein